MRASLALLLVAVPTIVAAAETAPRTTTPRTATKPATTKPTTTRKPAATTARRRAAPGVDTSETTWRLELGYGMTSTELDYEATATPEAPVAAGYAATSVSAGESGGTGSFRLNIGPLYGVHPLSRGEDGGWLWGVEVALAKYGSLSVDLPVADADTSGTSQNGRTFASDSSVETVAVGLPVGYAFDFSPKLSLECLGFFHVGVLHASYTSGENMVYGQNAPLALFENDLYNLYYDVGAKVNLAYRFANGSEALGTVGYVWGRSLQGTIKDSVTFYQGAANAQRGTYEESLTYGVSGAYLSVGAGYTF